MNNNDDSKLNSRRNFIKKASILFLSTLGIAYYCNDVLGKENRQKYKIDIEIYEVNGICYRRNKKGDKFEYPKDWEKLCPYLRGSMIEFIQQLEAGATLPWRYLGTPYEKVIDQEGITTEYVRCPDPSENHVVAKIIRTEIR